MTEKEKIQLFIDKEIYKRITDAGINAVPTESDFSKLIYPEKDHDRVMEICNEVWNQAILTLQIMKSG